jgi:hypothetical protein
MSASRFPWLARADAMPVEKGNALTGEHAASRDCWCQPRVTYTDPVTGNSVVVHNERRPVH